MAALAAQVCLFLGLSLYPSIPPKSFHMVYFLRDYKYSYTKAHLNLTRLSSLLPPGKALIVM